MVAAVETRGRGAPSRDGQFARCRQNPGTDPAEPLQTALDRHAPGLDLAQNPALFLPLWILDLGTRARADAQL
jgi:hypothetical protein